MSASFDNSAKVWSTRDWSLLRALSGHEGKVRLIGTCAVARSCRVLHVLRVVACRVLVFRVVCFLFFSEPRVHFLCVSSCRVLSVASFLPCLVLCSLMSCLVSQCRVESCRLLSSSVICCNFVSCLVSLPACAVSSMGVCAQVTGCDVAPNERKIVTCSFDRTVKVWAHESEF